MATAQRPSSVDARSQVTVAGEASVTRNTNGSALELRVTRGSPTPVPPAGETRKELYFLSNLDQDMTVIIHTVYCFKAGDKGNNEDKVAEVVKEALAKVLVHYYPLAGRFVVDAEEKLAVDCTGKGAVFVEADADCSLGDLGGMATYDPVALGKLLYVPAAQNLLDLPPVMVQVTKFKCGGFTLGLALNHCMFDGVGAMEFLSSWSETARGLPLSVPPFLDRTILGARVPPKIDHRHPQFLAADDIPAAAEEEFLPRPFCFDSATLEQLKSKAMEDGTLSGCTTFEALSSLFWRARTAALRPQAHHQTTELFFSVDVRARLDPPVPRGYFGNAVVGTTALCAGEELLEKPLSFAVGLVQGAVAMVTESYVRSAIDHIETRKGRAGGPSTATHIITAWSRFSFSATDFGWGEPVQVWPVAQPREVTVFLPHGKERKGITVLTSLPASAVATFQELMTV